jgi:hypothetical protein
MIDERRLTTEEKALKINLTSDIYGCFAEIGAGQEVAANFFKAGGSSGTIAYTQSAYDMKVSDSMYGPASRYVLRGTPRYNDRNRIRHAEITSSK